MVINTNCLWFLGYGDFWPLFRSSTWRVPLLCDWPYRSDLIFILMSLSPSYYMIDQLCCTWRKRLLFIVMTWSIRMVRGAIYSIYVAFTTLNASRGVDSTESFFFLKALHSLNLCLGHCRCCHLYYCRLRVWSSTLFLYLIQWPKTKMCL